MDRFGTAERCKEISQGYAFFAYPWDTSTTQESAPRRGVEDPSHPFRVRLFLGFTQPGVALAPARLTPG